MKLSIIIPIYNERESLPEALRRVENAEAAGLEKEIILVDDGSTDGTRDVLKRLDAGRYRIILKDKNEGKGAAIKAGLRTATGDFVIFQDADLEYDPNDYPVLLAPLLCGEADVVLGSRVLYGGMKLFGPDRAGPTSYFGCKLIAFSINLLYGRNFSDYYGCYKAIRTGLLRDISVEANGFEYDSELLCKLLKRNARIVEVPAAYHPRGRGEGKKITLRDGWAVMRSIFRVRFGK